MPSEQLKWKCIHFFGSIVSTLLNCIENGKCIETMVCGCRRFPILVLTHKSCSVLCKMCQSIGLSHWQAFCIAFILRERVSVFMFLALRHHTKCVWALKPLRAKEKLPPSTAVVCPCMCGCVRDSERTRVYMLKLAKLLNANRHFCYYYLSTVCLVLVMLCGCCNTFSARQHHEMPFTVLTRFFIETKRNSVRSHCTWIALKHSDGIATSKQSERNEKKGRHHLKSNERKQRKTSPTQLKWLLCSW